MKEQAVSPEPITQAPYGRVRNAFDPGDLPEPSATDEEMEYVLEEVAASQPVGGRERLGTEESAAMSTAVPLDPSWPGVSFVEALLLTLPTLRI